VNYAYEVNTLGVTGQRPKSLELGAFDPKHPVWQDAYAFVQLSIRQTGATRLISGGALGFDMIAGKAAVEAGIKLELALPFPGYDKRWGEKDAKRLRWLINRANSWHYVCEPGFAPWKYQTRNEYIVDECDYLLAFHNGKHGGTKNCLDYAKRVGRGYHVKDPSFLTNMVRS
jgi:uncharacterized phage-like protein YoqJ